MIESRPIFVPRVAPSDPCAVCMVPMAEGPLLYTVSWRDAEADTAYAASLFDSLGVTRGDTVHLIGPGALWPLIWPLERALIDRGAAVSAAEPFGFDASRTEMFVRRLNPGVVWGVSGEITAALTGAGHALATVFGRARTRVAVDTAAALALKSAGLACWTARRLGPAISFEPPEGGGARYDEAGWRFDSEGGELLISSRHVRATRLEALRTGVPGRVEVRGGASLLLFD